MDTNSVMMICVLVVCSFFILIIVSGIFRPGKKLKKMTKNMNEFIDENEETLKQMSTKSAKISEEANEITAKAIKRGFTEADDKKIYCKECGTKIDEDSTFCKNCGGKQ